MILEDTKMFYALLFCVIFVALVISPWAMSRISKRAALAKRRDQALAIARSGRGHMLTRQEFSRDYRNTSLEKWWDEVQLVRVRKGELVAHLQLAPELYGFLKVLLPRGGFINVEVLIAVMDAAHKASSVQKALEAADPLSAGNRTELVGRRREKTALN